MKPKLLLPLILLIHLCAVLTAQPRFSITYSRDRGGPFDGRLLLIIAIDSTKEPRFQVGADAGPTCQQIFGINVDGWKAGVAAVVDKSVFGFPRKSLVDVSRGEYWVQALLHKYETFHCAEGHVVKLPSSPILVDPRSNETINIPLGQEIPPIEPPRGTKFWGRDMYLGANVLLPWGWEDHPNARYPLAVFHGHFSPTFGGFRETPRHQPTA